MPIKITQAHIDYRNRLWKLADVAFHVGIAHGGDEARSHAMHREELLDRLADEHVALLDELAAARARIAELELAIYAMLGASPECNYIEVGDGKVCRSHNYAAYPCPVESAWIAMRGKGGE